MDQNNEMRQAWSMKLEIDSFNSDIFGIVMANLILDKELLESRFKDPA